VAKTILLAGTWGLERERAWWQPHSPFWDEASAHGVSLLGEHGPFLWSTALDGVFGQNSDWLNAGGSLLMWAHLMTPGAVNLIAHSHGGQVALYAAAQGLQVKTLVTVATPVRRDLRKILGFARPNIATWIHVRSDWTDYMQLLGELMSGNLGLFRNMKLADRNITVPGVGHSGLLEPSLWTRETWWNYVKEEGGV